MLKDLDKKYFKIAVPTIKKELQDEIIARCPVCGDSAYSKNKARLHLYNKGGDTGFVNCFNGDCPVHNKTMYSFLRDFYPALFNDYQREFRINSLQALQSSGLESIKKEPNDIVFQDFSVYFNCVEFNSNALDYIKSRGINYTKDKYGQWYFSNVKMNIGDKTFNLANSLVIPLYCNDKWYGFYSRNISQKLFSTYMNPKNIGYKLWNWFNIDKSKDVYVFEGIFDAISAMECGVQNCIACLGAKLPEERFKELKRPIMCFDNDRTGLMNALEYLDKGAKVFIAPYKFKDTNEALINGVDLKSVIVENTFEGILGRVKIKSIL